LAGGDSTRGTLLALAVLALAPARAFSEERLRLESTPVSLEAGRPERESVGELRFLGGLVLRSPDEGFGGLSGARVGVDGTLLTAVSDEGRWFTIALEQDAHGRLVRARGLESGPLVGVDGEPLPDKVDQDAEDLTVLADGALMVSFEHRHRLLVYRGTPQPLAARPTSFSSPPGLERAPRNGGIEALATLADGRIVALTEEQPDGDGLAAWIGDGSGNWERLRYRPAAAPRPSAAAGLPGGDLIVLERHYSPASGLWIRLVRVSGAAIRPGAELAGRLVAELKPPLAIDNFEALAVRPAPRPEDEALVYLLSDDNFNSLQRTLLLLFALPREPVH
jgi:hypothetical protein